MNHSSPLKHQILALSDQHHPYILVRHNIFIVRLLTAASFTRSYQFNPPLSREETITAILVKALTVFPAPDFSLCLHLLPPSTLTSFPRNGPDTSPLAEAVQKLNVLNNLLETADYSTFWATVRSDDLYADLVAEVSGFEELMRVRIAATVSQAVREVERASWRIG